MKKTVLSLILILALCFTVSCGEDGVKNRDYNESEVLVAARELLEKSIIVNEVFFGTGIIPDKSNANYANGDYYPADIEHLEELGFDTLEELLEITGEVYTSALCEIIYNNKIIGNYNMLSRYYEAESLGEKYIMVYAGMEISDMIMYDNKVEYDFSTLKVKGSRGDLVYVTVDVILTSTDGETMRSNEEFPLLEEENGFRLDSYSFAKFYKSE